MDPDKRRYAIDGEAQRHYIDIDHYGVWPFDSVPERWSDACDKFSEDTLQTYGIVPWHILKMKYRLQKAFENKDVERILQYSSEIGHYIGDAHVPLHTTENYNGQLTNQKGIHGLWESRLVELYADQYDYFVGKAEYIQNPQSTVWTIIKASHLAVDSVLKIEKQLTKEFDDDKKYAYVQRGQQMQRNYSKEFSERYHIQLNNMVERRMQSSIFAIGNFWLTAWVDAGQPDLQNLRDVKLSKQFKEKLIESISGKHAKGRVCD